MTIQEVADRFFQLSQEGKWNEIQNELFAQNAQSIEPPTAQGLQSVQGLDAIKKKGEAWNNMVEQMHGGYANKPQVAGNHFTVTMGMDVTLKGAGRTQMDEVAVYEVKDGKIVKEQFFF
jgi:hypothetical protein